MNALRYTAAVDITGLPGADLVAAHSRYNALIRTLVSFERAGERVR